jgi:hypothetical protein
MTKDEEKSSVGEVPGPEAATLDSLPKTRWERSWPTIACGAGLFSDGYLNGVRPHTFTLHDYNPLTYI